MATESSEGADTIADGQGRFPLAVGETGLSGGGAVVVPRALADGDPAPPLPGMTPPGARAPEPAVAPVVSPPISLDLAQFVSAASEGSAGVPAAEMPAENHTEEIPLDQVSSLTPDPVALSPAPPARPSGSRAVAPLPHPSGSHNVVAGSARPSGSHPVLPPPRPSGSHGVVPPSLPTPASGRTLSGSLAVPQELDTGVSYPGSGAAGPSAGTRAAGGSRAGKRAVVSIAGLAAAGLGIWLLVERQPARVDEPGSPAVAPGPARTVAETEKAASLPAPARPVEGPAPAEALAGASAEAAPAAGARTSVAKPVKKRPARPRARLAVAGGKAARRPALAASAAAKSAPATAGKPIANAKPPGAAGAKPSLAAAGKPVAGAATKPAARPAGKSGGFVDPFGN